MDFDADGRDDLLVRRPVFEPAGEAFGGVEIYCVHRRELMLLLTSEWPNDLFGFSAASAGDITGDGFTDVVVGAPYALWRDDSPDAALDEAAIRAGRDAEPAPLARKNEESAPSDVGESSPNHATSEPSVVWPHGRIDVFSGATGQLAMSLHNPEAHLLGRVVAGVGDVNGDGVPDVAASGYVRDASGDPHERVFIFCGLTGDAFRVFLPERTGGNFGHTITGLGDLDGDGHADIAIGAPDTIADAPAAAGQRAMRGVVYVFRGEPMPDIAEVLLSNGSITQVRHAGRHAFTRIAAQNQFIEFARHIMPGPTVMVDATHGTMIDDPADTRHDARPELIGTMLALSLRFDEATRQTAWLAETIDPLTGVRLARAELPRFERGGDVTRDLAVGDDDLHALIAMLGITPDPSDPFNADLTNNGTIDTADLERAIEHTGDRHELLDLVANTGDAMFIVMDELEMPGRLATSEDNPCSTPVRVRNAPGIAILCGSLEEPTLHLPGVSPFPQGGDGAMNDSDGISPGGGSCPGCPIQECCNYCCYLGFGGPDCCAGVVYPCDLHCTWTDPINDPPDYWFWWPGSVTNPGGGGDPPGDPPGGCNYLEDPTCLNIPSQFDCDNPDNTLSQSYRDACCDTSPPTGGGIGSGDPEHPQDQDDDCDGTPNWADCDSECYIGDPSTDCACQDDDQDGIKNQDECDHQCSAQTDECCLSIDIKIDSDNNGQIDEQDAEAESEGGAQLVFVNRSDLDRDGLVDCLDGYDVFGEGIEKDDHADGSRFVQVILEVASLNNCSEAMITIEYDYSDPLATIDGVSPAPGAARLWTTQSSPRIAEPADEGGHLLPPGSYLPTEIGLGTAGTTVDLWMEVVRPSSSEGDISLTIVLEAEEDSCGGTIIAAQDTVLMSGVQIRLMGRGPGDSEFWERDTLIASTLHDPSEEMPNGYLPGAWQTYKVLVFDPRDGIESVEIAGTSFTLSPVPGTTTYESPEFICLPPAVDIPPGASLPQMPIVTIAGGESSIYYNPQQEVLTKKQIRKMEAGDKLLTQVDEIVLQMEAENWLPPDPPAGGNPDPGAFGKEVHKRATDTLHGKPGIAMNVWVNNATKEVLWIGPGQASGFPTQGTTQIDAVVILDKGYSLEVGETYDVSKCAAREIKMSVSDASKAAIDDQLAKLEQFSADGTPLLVRSRRHWKASTGWIDNKKFLSTKRVMMACGIVGTTAGVGSWVAPVHALVTSAEHDKQIEKLELAYNKVINASDTATKNIHQQEAFDLTKEYFKQFWPDEVQGVVDLVLYAKTIEIMTGTLD